MSTPGRDRPAAPAPPTRSSGVLLHVTSLPSPSGTGDLGPGAYQFVDFLADAGQGWWQVLPLGPFATDAVNSPYRPCSAFAGNPLLISTEVLVQDGWLDGADAAALAVASATGERADYAGATREKHAILARAHDRFVHRGGDAAFDAFCARHAAWLEPFARFRALAAHHGGAPWWAWPEPFRHGRAMAHAPLAGEMAEAARREQFVQFLFDSQWNRLRDHAHARGVRIFGDVPFYVDHDSADAWCHPELFKLNADGTARAVAGVPPDTFSATGQLWGNPVYEWAAHSHDDYAWWTARLRRTFEHFDRVRLDHFRALAAHWEVPAGHTTAEHGVWVEGPGRALLDALLRECPGGSLVAEDLGTITADVRALLDGAGVPGMKVLLFAFDGDTAHNPFAPHHHPTNAVVYTGTHDNNTARGWFELEAGADARERLARYLGRECTPGDVSNAFVRMALMSVCNTAILPLQDVLGLGADARMNNPAHALGNWEWRVTRDALTPERARHLAQLTEAYGRR